MPSLLLHAFDPQWRPASGSPLIDELRRLALIGQAAPGATDRWLAGTRFLNHIMFLGCSPHIELDPQQAAPGAEVCMIAVREYPDVTLLGARAEGVRCPFCRATLGEVSDRPWDTLFTCPACGRPSRLFQLDWRRGAGFGHCFVEILGVHPHEAVPSDELLCVLERYAGVPWRYFYA